MYPVSPYEFGPCVWDTLLLYAYNFPDAPQESQQRDMLVLVTLLLKFLPCPSCGTEAKNYIEKYPPDVSSRTKLVTYIVEFHNYVNVKLKKATMTVDEAKAAFVDRLKIDSNDKTSLPRAMEVRREDAKRITVLQQRVAELSKKATNYDQFTSHSLYFYTTIGVSIVAGMLLIALIAVIVKYKRRLRKCLGG